MKTSELIKKLTKTKFYTVSVDNIMENLGTVTAKRRPLEMSLKLVKITTHA